MIKASAQTRKVIVINTLGWSHEELRPNKEIRQRFSSHQFYFRFYLIFPLFSLITWLTDYRQFNSVQCLSWQFRSAMLFSSMLVVIISQRYVIYIDASFYRIKAAYLTPVNCISAQLALLRAMRNLRVVRRPHDGTPIFKVQFCMILPQNRQF